MPADSLIMITHTLVDLNLVPSINPPDQNKTTDWMLLTIIAVCFGVFQTGHCWYNKFSMYKKYYICDTELSNSTSFLPLRKFVNILLFNYLIVP